MIYLYRCPICTTRVEVAKSLAEIDREEACPRCANVMLRQITAPAVLGDLPGYSCPITGDWIEGRRQHEANLAKHGCRILESGEHEHRMARRKDDEALFDRRLEEDVSRKIDALPTEKRHRLEEEIDHGFSLDVTRSTPKAG